MPEDVTGPPIAPPWLVRLCQPSRVRWLAPLLGFLLTLPSVFSGYVQDDHLYRQRSLETTLHARRAAWDAFNWLASDAEVDRYRERGIAQVTWWTPTSARTRFFRPLASLLQAFEFRFFGDAPWVMHVDRALLYAAIVFLCGRLLARLSTTPVAGAVACLLYAIDDAHAFSTGWISAANTLLTLAFGLLALLMHDRWRRDRSLGGLALSLVAFGLSLLSSEGGLAVLGYLAAYTVFLEAGPWKRRLAAVLPAASVAAAYLAFYARLGFGVTGSFDYLAPTENLWQTALAVSSGTVTGTVSQLLSIPLLATVLQVRGGALVAAAVLAALVALFWRFLRSSKTVAFFAVGTVLSMVPFSFGMMGDRLLFWAGLGASGLLGELLVVASLGGTLRRFIARALLATNTVVSLVFFVPLLFWLAMIETNIEKLEALVTSADTVMINGHPIADNCAAGLRYEKHGAWPAHFYHLYDGFEGLTVKRTGARTLLVTPRSGWFASSPISRGATPKELAFSKGQTFELQLMTATIEELTPDGRPASVSFTFKQELSRFEWLEHTMSGPRRFSVPAPGEEVSAELWSF